MLDYEINKTTCKSQTLVDIEVDNLKIQRLDFDIIFSIKQRRDTKREILKKFTIQNSFFPTPVEKMLTL